MSINKPLLILALLLSWSIRPLSAQEPPAGRERVWTLTVTPAAEHSPALEHRFTYRLWEQVPGNGNPLLQNAINLSSGNGEREEQFQALRDQENPPIDELRKHLPAYESALQYLELATKRTTYNPETPFRELGIEALLPTLSPTRKLAIILDMRIRIEIHDRDIPAAIRSLRTGYTLARQIGDQHTLVEALVGIGIAGVMTERTRALMELEAAPNLYWSLAELRPLIDGRNAILGEASWFYFSFEGLDLANRDRFTPDQWRDVLTRIGQLFQISSSEQNVEPLALAAIVAGSLGPSRQLLLQQGYQQDQLNKMTPQEIVGRAMLLDFDIAMDNMTKAWHLPTPQALAATGAAEKRFAEQTGGGMLPFARTLIPALGRARLSFARLDRDLAMLMTIEALRAHAAANDGLLPASFDDITVLPVPLNPFTGRPFEYRRTEAGCEILCPPAVGDSNNETLRVVLALRK